MCKLALLFLTIILCRPVYGENPRLKLRIHAREADAVACVQTVAHHGKRRLDTIATDIDRGNLTEAAALIKKHRDEIEDCKLTLEGKNNDPRIYPEAYKRLEILVRRFLRQLDDLLPGNDEDPSLLFVKDDLHELHRAMIYDLFPE